MNKTSQRILEREMSAAEDQVNTLKADMQAKQEHLAQAQTDYAIALKIYNDINETLNPTLR